MLSIGKRVAGIGAVTAALALAGPVATAGAAPQAPGPPSPVAGAFQAGWNGMVFGWNAGAQGAAFGWSAGAAAMGLPFRFVVAPGPLGVGHVIVAPVR
jgi:hypothetical protein